MEKQTETRKSASEQDGVRRVVTGLAEGERAVVLFDGVVPLEPGRFGIRSVNLWITGAYPPELTNEDPAHRRLGVSPPDNGTKFRIVEFPPLDAETEAKMPPTMIMDGVTNPPAKGLPVKHPMVHRTRSLDYAVVLSGEIDLMLDDTSIHLKEGDTVVQQATNHGWINRGVRPCRILVVLMDSKEP